MRFRELLNRAKTMDDTAMVQILELYNPLLYKYANVNSRFDQDLYEEFVYRLPDTKEKLAGSLILELRKMKAL